MKQAKSAGEIMTTRLVTIPSDLPLAQVARLLVRNRIGSAPVVETGTHSPIGELSRQACMEALLDAVYEDHPVGTVTSSMLPWTERVGENASIVEMVQKFRDCAQKFLPVFREDKFLGVVTRTDVTRAFLALLERIPDRQIRVLYLSALHASDEAPDL